MDALIYNYDDYYLGNKKNITALNEKTPQKNDAAAIFIIRYAIEKYLKWRPETAYDYFDGDVARKMKLETYMSKVIFPDNLDRDIDYWYYISRCYPDLFPYDHDETPLHMYLKVLRKERKHLPSGFFSGVIGKKRAAECLRYLLTNYFTFTTKDDMYALFGSPHFREKLSKEFSLDLVFDSLYDYPIQFLHESLDQSERDNVLYAKYYFLESLRRSKTRKKATTTWSKVL